MLGTQNKTKKCRRGQKKKKVNTLPNLTMYTRVADFPRYGKHRKFTEIEYKT